MPAVMVTTRHIQNSHTGIDASVSEYQEIRGKMMSGHVEYQILVVTRLPAFKSAKHKPEDTVQFVVSKKYSEIEEFHQKLAQHYPQASLPPVPRKVLFVGETDIRERRATFDEIMRFISKEEGLANSPEFLEFLGTQSSSAADSRRQTMAAKQPEEAEREPLDFFRDEEPSPALSPPVSTLKETAEEDIEEDEDEEEILDPLGIMKTKRPKKPAVVKVAQPMQKPKHALFDEEVDPDEELFGAVRDPLSTRKTSFSKNELKLFEDLDLGGTVRKGDSLLLPTACESQGHAFNTVLDDDTEELFRVEEDFEKLLKLGTKSSCKPKPKVPAKPPLPKKPTIAAKPVPISAPPPKKADHNVQAMDQTDIMKYIQDNESADKDTLSLF
ncbi:HCLS1-binding protein 3 isoform X2 [Ambystoma mexicanum]|uniref:HCLS1-binding protein 3 isoform X2 n=1 Tax=Ambystoma mexicanum TaxID=8296 RepID=UPI0037E8368C